MAFLKSTKSVAPPALHSAVTAQGISWSAGGGTPLRPCGDEAPLILEQLADDGVIEKQDSCFEASWESVFFILKHPEYGAQRTVLGIPDDINLSPALESAGTLSDRDFGITIKAWTDPFGRAVDVARIGGPVVMVGRRSYVISEAAWRVAEKVTAFWRRGDDDREERKNRQEWGTIRQMALSAGCRLSDFLYRSVVLTPEKLTLGLNKVTVGDIKVVEVIPSFANAPAGWLDAFDRRQQVPDHFDIPTTEGVVQIIIRPAVKTVLQQIKAMPGRRVSGTRAEAFVMNPFAALGEDATEALDAEQFEQARMDAELVFDRFTAHVESDHLGNPTKIGLLIEHGVPTKTTDTPAVIFFESDDEAEGFIVSVRARIAQSCQVCAWRDYEFELMGNTSLELEQLSDALARRRNSLVQITYAQVFDLSSYSPRIEEIGHQKPYYSPYIAKKVDGDDWIPENLTPMVSWTPEGSAEPSVIPLTPELEKVLREKLAKAEINGETSIEIPSLPKSVPVQEARNIIEAFENFRKDPPLSASRPEASASPIRRVPAPTLVIKPNIADLDYEEIRREQLAVYSEIPVMPATLRVGVELKDHQKSGVAWLQHLFALSPGACRGAVLADDMGLGKTLQLLTFLAASYERDPHMLPALIVAPVSLLENWQDEINRFFQPGALPVATLYGTDLQAQRLSKSLIDKQLLQSGLVKFLKPGWVGSAKIVLTTYETLRDLEFSFAAEKWSVMVCDEAQKIKNPNALVTRAAKKQNARFKIACTGTPVENTLADLWCLFDFVQPGMLGALNHFGQRYRRPIEAKTDEEKARVEELRQKISAQILRRTKAEVAKDLKQKIVVDTCDNLRISPYQLSVYTQAIDLYRNRNDPGARTPFSNYLGLLHYLRLICTDPRGIGAEHTKLLPLDAYCERSPKLNWLLRQLREIQAREEKAIIFCEFRSIQRLLRHYIFEVFSLTADIINGDTAAAASHHSSRQKRIKAFQETSGFNVIILSPVAVGFGVNIQAANHVIHFTRTWNPAKEDQATDRAYRIGQTRDVYVYYPIVAAPDFTTFDVKLDHLLSIKRELAGDMLNGSGDIRPGEFDDLGGGSGGGEYIDPSVTFDDAVVMNAKYLEALTAALWQAQGYSQVYRTPDTNDDGVDVVAITGERGVLIQCKSSQQENHQLSWNAIKDVVTGHAAYRRKYPGDHFDLACLTNQSFNGKAHEQARLNGVTLIDNSGIADLLQVHTVTFRQVEEFLR